MKRHAKLWLLPMALVIAGCSSMKPPPDGSPALKEAYEKDRTLPNAVAYAESLRDAYLTRSGDMRVEERVNGLALIGIGMATGGLVARGIGKSETLGLGLAGVGLYSANNWANPKTERLIYAETGTAVHCAIAIIDPMRPAYEKLNALQTGMDQLTSGSKNLDATLGGFVGSDEPRVVRARNAVSKARAAASAAEVALAYLKAAGPSLVTAVGGMRADVEVQLVRGGPDYSALVSSLVQQKVLPAAAPLAVPDGKKESGSAITLEAPTSRLEDQTSAVEKLVAMLNVRPSATDLQRCRVDPKAAGITMRVEPAVISLKAGEKAVALASGGVLPYTAVPVLDSIAADQFAS